MHLSIGARLACMFMYCCRVFPIKNNKIVFSSFFGKKYNDNPRAISEELATRKDIKQIWLLSKNVKHPEYIKAVPPVSPAGLFHLATAKVWVDNSRKRGYIRKRKGQFYIQTWHGGVGFKAVERGAIETLTKQYVQAAKNDSSMADTFVSECEWKTEQYRRDFWYTGEIMKCGMPRSDKFFKCTDEITETVKKEFGIDAKKRILLYAPTFRKDNRTDSYQIDYHNLVQVLHNKFGGEWCVIVRLHPEVSSQANFIEYGDIVINGTPYDDLNDILIASDILVSDYSSCIFDALYIDKIVFIYATDIESYIANDRHLNFSFDELPIDISQSNNELEQIIRDFNKIEYENKRVEFVNKMGYYSDGHASKTVAQRIIDEMRLED